jgi:hypothetical protein
MDLRNYKCNVEVKNISGGRIALGRLAIAHNDSKIINPMFFSDDVIGALVFFLAKGAIEIKEVESKKDEKQVESNSVKKETIKNDKGEKREHTVFDPETAKKERAIKVEENNDNGKAIEVGDLDKTLAIDFLEQHWKKIEKELQDYKSAVKLEFYLSVANEIGMNGNKKYELIEDRIKELKK